MVRKELIIITLFSILFISCQKNGKWRHSEGETQGTTYHITYLSEKELGKEIEDELERFGRSLNLFDSTSTITKVNKGRRTYVGNDTLFVNVIRRSKEISELTNGAFDITVSPLVKLWGFNHAALPKKVTEKTVDSVRTLVGWNKIILRDGWIEKADDRIEIDANAIAQGYTCDIIADLLEQNGVHDYLIEIGGEIRASGCNKRNAPWRVGINRPVFDTLAMNEEIAAVVELPDISIGTSGNYHKFHKVDGHMIGHEINPHTGYPELNDILSASVIASDGMTADALATASMIMGAKKALELCERLQGVEAYLIILDEAGKENIRMTSGMKKYLKEEKINTK